MAYAVKRAGGYAGYYRDAHGRRCSAGVFSTEAEAIIRARDLEGSTPVERAQVSGLAADLGTYAEHFEVWLIDVKVNGGLAPRSWMSYELNIRKRVLPLIGDLPVASLNQKVIRDMLAVMTRNGVTPHVKFQCKCAIGRSLWDLVPSVLASNPTHGIHIAKPPTAPFALLTPEDFAKVWAMLTEPQALFAAVLVSTGARFGEGSELRVKDIDVRNGEGWIRRRVSSVNGGLDNGCRYVVLHGTKSGLEHGRSIGLPSLLLESLQAWIDTNDLAAGDLLFPSRLVSLVRSGVDQEKIDGNEFTGLGAWSSSTALPTGTAGASAGATCACLRGARTRCLRSPARRFGR